MRTRFWSTMFTSVARLCLKASYDEMCLNECHSDRMSMLPSEVCTLWSGEQVSAYTEGAKALTVTVGDCYGRA